MDIGGKIIWQQGSGDTNRNYSKYCIDWGVILNGPGYANRWPECKEKLLSDGWKSKKLTDLKRFAEKMKEGDLVVLRLGTKLVMGVGEIVGEYEWREEFGDIDGWDLQHVRRVRWLWSSHNDPKPFDTWSLKQGDTTQKLNEGPVKEWLKELQISKSAYNKPLIELPEYDHKNAELDLNSLAEGLYNRGAPWRSIEHIVRTIEDLIRIAKWYRIDSSPSEHETVAYLAIPLLRSLGWSPQKMAVEWQNIDLALFKELQREDDNLSMAVEAKKIGSSYFVAEKQVLKYATPRPNCHRAVVTDGIRYGVYVKENNKYQLKSYLNLLRLSSEYPIIKCAGAIDAMVTMAADWQYS